jgi:hypothetical protein
MRGLSDKSSIPDHCKFPIWRPHLYSRGNSPNKSNIQFCAGGNVQFLQAGIEEVENLRLIKSRPYLAVLYSIPGGAPRTRSQEQTNGFVTNRPFKLHSEVIATTIQITSLSDAAADNPPRPSTPDENEQKTTLSSSPDTRFGRH